MEIVLLFINPTVSFRTFTAQFYFSNVKKYLDLVQDTSKSLLIFYYNFVLNILLRRYKYVSAVKTRAKLKYRNSEISQQG